MMGRLGLYYQEAGELEKSVNILETIIEDDPTYVEAYNYLSVSYARLGRTRDAIETNEKLLEKVQQLIDQLRAAQAEEEHRSSRRRD